MASYFQEDHHGSGRKIGISPGKPENACECEFRFPPLDPGQIYWDYHKYKKDDPEMAGQAFVEAYRKQCEEFVAGVKKNADEEGKSVQEILPFQDGDTLLSWELKGNMTYRAIAAEYLRELGYDVEEC